MTSAAFNSLWHPAGDHAFHAGSILRAITHGEAMRPGAGARIQDERAHDERAYAAGFAAGIAAGVAQGRQDAQQDAEGRAALADALAALRPMLPDAFADMLHDALRAAVADVVGTVGVDAAILQTRVDDLLDQLLPECPAPVLRLHPADMAMLNGVDDRVTMVADDRLARGAPTLCWAKGTLGFAP